MEASAGSQPFAASGEFGAEHGDVRDPAIRRAARALLPARHRPAIVGALRALARRGDRVHCPCCDGDFDRFVRHRGRPHAKCPRCGALERHRLLWLYLTQRTDLLSRPLSLLHFAPEHAYRRRLSRMPGLRYVTADLDSPLAMHRCDIMDQPFADGSFDAVLCSHVLEHVEDDRRALAEIRRVLRPNGWAILMSPIDRRRDSTFEDAAIATPEERHRAFGQSDHVRLYGRDFAERVAATGFAVRTETYLERLDEETIARLGLRREQDDAFCDEDVFICVRTG
jgi:SAM-dependent methyltransferase